MADAPSSIPRHVPEKQCPSYRSLLHDQTDEDRVGYCPNLFISIFCFHLISFLEKESRATQVGCPALSEYNRIFFLISYSVFAAAITLVVFALPPGGQQIRSFFICFGSFFFASRIASNFVSSVVLRRNHGTYANQGRHEVVVVQT